MKNNSQKQTIGISQNSQVNQQQLVLFETKRLLLLETVLFSVEDYPWQGAVLYEWAEPRCAGCAGGAAPPFTLASQAPHPHPGRGSHLQPAALQPGLSI